MPVDRCANCGRSTTVQRVEHGEDAVDLCKGCFVAIRALFGSAEPSAANPEPLTAMLDRVRDEDRTPPDVGDVINGTDPLDW